MRIHALLVLLLLVPFVHISYGELELSTSSKVYAPGQPLFVFGQTSPDDSVIIRVFGPDDTITKFDQVTAESDGSYQHIVLTWPEATVTFPYGTYAIDAVSTQSGESNLINVRFAASDELVETPVERNIHMLIFAPDMAAVGDTLRVFIQTTSDGLLVGNNPVSLLGTTHVHLPDDTVHDISDSFEALHTGLFYADYTPQQEGTYVFHAVAFNQGTISHGSAATTVLKQDIGDISDQIIHLNTILAETSAELDHLKTEVAEFKGTLEQASNRIDTSVTSVSESVSNIEEASSQLNSLFFPVVALIGIIVALQITTLARSR
ncbi:MAG: methyl-accepting chemotaxis protein [Cenarchaeum sp. SB0665_bin_23]|nr:methyl-accepting chemotaxis protein [Cenarchaeum sp. SB0665_bin_23]MYG32584.1 methyl-accepting chemotaxis protein [Cenarchaeum sp. SB0677_bin_16]